MKFLLVNHRLETKEVYRDIGEYPYALLKIGGYLKDKGHDVEFVDANHHDLSERQLEEELEVMKESFSPDRIFLSSVFTYFWQDIKKCIDVCKRVFPDVMVVLGGNYATLCPEHAERTGADKVFQGNMVFDKGWWTDVGLLDYVPEYDFIRTSKGCPKNCAYCATHILNNLELREPEDVVDEIEYKYREYGIDNFKFIDNNPLLNYEEHMKKVIYGIRDRDIDVTYSFYHSSNFRRYTDEVVTDLIDTGYDTDGFYVSFESSQKSLSESMNREFPDIEDFAEFMSRVEEYFDEIMVFLFLGFPGQEIEHLLEDVIMLNALGARILFSPFTPVPGTKEYKRMKKEGRLEGTNLSELKPLNFPFYPEEKRELLNELFEKFQNLSRSVSFLSTSEDTVLDRDIGAKIDELEDKLWDLLFLLKGEKNVRKFYKEYDDLLAEVSLEYIEEDKKVLEVGSGCGQVSERILDNCARLTTLDFAKCSENEGSDVYQHKKEDFFENSISESFDLLVDNGVVNTTYSLEDYFETVDELCRESAVFVVGIFMHDYNFFSEHVKFLVHEKKSVVKEARRRGFEPVEERSLEGFRVLVFSR